MKLKEILEVMSVDQTICVEEVLSREIYSLNEKRYLKLEVGLLDATVRSVFNDYYKCIGERGVTIQIKKHYSTPKQPELPIIDIDINALVVEEKQRDGKNFIVINGAAWYPIENFTIANACQDYVETHSNGGWNFIPRFHKEE